MKRASAILGSVIFLVVAPGTIAVYIPWTICRWRFASPLLGFFPFRIIGVLMITAGLPVLLDSFVRFAIKGMGTPAPVAPPQHLVMTGLYRHVRNPMYVAVSLLIFGQGLLFGSVRLLEFGVVVWLAFFAFVVFYEEPALRRKFGKDYEEFCARVPRWIPRLKPIQP
jgi:protein-S-isoprenylcysteine O-methyltransferase Ste14